MLSRNDTDKPIVPEGDELLEPLQPGHVRIYEFLHGHEDITIEEWERRLKATQDDPVYQILFEEIQKEIHKEVIAIIEKKCRGT